MQLRTSRDVSQAQLAQEIETLRFVRMSEVTWLRSDDVCDAFKLQ
jgi:hypothetical protein